MTVNELAQKNGYLRAEDTKKFWNGYHVYKPIENDDPNEIIFTGYPSFILVKDGKAHFTTGDEYFTVRREIYPEEYEPDEEDEE